jgi:hypothetical protein
MSTDVSEVRAAYIIRAMIIDLMMEVARISETSVDIQLRAWEYIPELSELQSFTCFNNPRKVLHALKYFV